MQSAWRSASAAAFTSAGFSASLAPFTTKIRFCPFGSTKMGATPLDRLSTSFTWRVSMPCFLKFSMVAGPKRSFPTRATMVTSAPHRRAATAWLAPFPPNPRSNFCPKMVSPGFGNWSVNVVRSILQLPTTAMRGRLAIGVFLKSAKNAEFIQRDAACQRGRLRKLSFSLPADTRNELLEKIAAVCRDRAGHRYARRNISPVQMGRLPQWRLERSPVSILQQEKPAHRLAHEWRG